MNKPAADVLDADGLVQVMRTFSDALRRHEDLLNRLNVFPVEDGDTGKNMADTAESAVAGLAPAGTPMAGICSAISEQSLMGAKGNSGVILCQMLRAMTGVLAGADHVDACAVARAFTEADAAARAAVMDPKEGTILTVAGAAARAASAAAAKGLDLVPTLEAARDESVAALAETPHLLRELRDAGVVDSGGAGLVLLYEAFLHVAGGGPMPDTLPIPAEMAAAASGLPRHHAVPATADDGASRVHIPGPGAHGGEEARPHSGPAPAEGPPEELRYEVVYLLSAPDEAMPAFKDVWAGIGDSIVVVGGGGLWKCHIHTNDVGAAIEAALDIGKPRQIRVTDLLEQVEEERWVRAAEAAAAAQPAASAASSADGLDRAGVSAPAGAARPAGADPAPPRTSVVPVVPGDGIGRIFHSMRAPHFVVGGQSMNPSTGEILAVVESAPGEEVVILPNNSNLLLVAEQVQAVTGKKVRVVPTPGIQEGLMAVVPYDPEAGAEENAAAMAAAAAGVTAGEVARAVRAGRYPGGSFEAGDWIGLSRAGVVSSGSSAGEAACGLLDAISSGDNEIVAVIAGEGASAAETRRISEWLSEHRPELAVETHQGGQPLYAYLISVE